MSQQVRIGWRSGSSSQTATSIVTSGLILNLDAGNSASYSGSGTTWTNLVSGNNGTLTNGVGYNSANGGALTFDGVNDYVDCSSINTGNTFTVQVWAKISRFGGNPGNWAWNRGTLVANSYNWGGNTGFFFFVTSQTSAAGGYAPTPGLETFSISIGQDATGAGAPLGSLANYVNRWVNLSVVVNGTTPIKLYINGTEIPSYLGQGNGPSAINYNAPLIIGARLQENSDYTQGAIGSVNVYNRALTSAELLQNFDATKTRFGYSTLDTDVQAFVTAASITDATQQSAVNTLVTSLKSAGIWTKMRALYPFVGGTATSHKFNLKDPRDVDAAYRLVFNGGWVHSSTGAQPNGSNTYANTYFNPTSQSLSISSQHLSYYSRTNIIENAVEIGVISSTNVNFLGLYVSSTSGTRAGLASSVRYNNSVVVDTRGLFVATRTDTSNIKVHVNGSIQASQSAPSTGNDNFPMYIGAYGALTPDLFSTKETAFASIGDGLTDTEALAFYTAVQTYQTTLGRHVGVPIVADTDAQAFLNAAIITDSTQASAVNTLVTQLKSANIWTKMKALYPFVGGTATTHKFNLKDPRDLDAAYRLVFNGGWVHSSTGAKPNGTTGYARTFLIPKTTFGRNISNTGDNAIIHVSKYSRTNQTITSNFWLEGVYSLKTGGGTSGFNPADLVFLNHSFSTQYQGSSSTTIGGVDPNASIYGFSNNTQGYFLFTRTSNNMFRAFRNNNLVGTNTYDVTTSVETPQTEYLLGVRNDSYNNQFNPFGYNPLENSFTSIGDGLTDAEAAAFYNAVQAFQTTLGRQV